MLFAIFPQFDLVNTLIRSKALQVLNELVGALPRFREDQAEGTANVVPDRRHRGIDVGWAPVIRDGWSNLVRATDCLAFIQCSSFVDKPP